MSGNGRASEGGRVADRYELEELVGQGGTSHVYKARDTLLDRNVALKILHAHFGDDDEYVKRFRHEARAVAQLSHPNIVTVIDRGDEDGRQFIVFEFIDGENLKEFAGRTGPLPVRRAIEITLEIAAALSFAHEHGLVHRDVKPQNVLLNGEGRAKVTDFGISRSLDLELGLTQTGTVLGTSNYIAPEQASGKPVDAHTDVYSLGVVLFELLAAELPFPGENFIAVALKHINDAPPSVLEKRPDVPVRLAAAVGRALEKDPERRFPTMADFAAELRACLAELGQPHGDRTPIGPGPVVRSTRLPRARAGSRSRRPLVLGILALLAAAAVLAGVLALGGSKKPGGASPGGGSGGHAVRLAGVGSYDPQGDHVEHNEAVARATDGNPSTFWTTEHYLSFSKNGVGLVLDAGRPVKLARLTITTDTPGFTAEIQSGARPSGGFAADSAPQTVGRTATFDLTGATARYYVVWITRLAGSVAHVNEVKASS